MLTTCHTKKKRENIIDTSKEYNMQQKQGCQISEFIVWISVFEILFTGFNYNKTVKSATICLFFLLKFYTQKTYVDSFIQGFECGFTIFLVKSWLKY